MRKFYPKFYLTVAVILLGIISCYGQVGGQIPLNPKAIPQFVDPLPHFAGNRIDASGGSLTISYEKTDQVIVSTGTVLAGGIVGTPVLPPFKTIGLAHLWAYKVSNGTVTKGPLWPAYTIEARQGTPVNVTYVNNLAGETYASVNLVADQTLHWADPLMEGMMATPPNMMNMLAYEGPIPVVPHLHGGEVASESDGGPDAWFTPGKEETGPSWGMDGTDDEYYYPNSQEAATLWWHDHALGVTRLNVYAGLAGFYFLRGKDEETAKLPGWTGDDLVKEALPVGKTGPVNPNPYLPEIEVVFQDRMFDTNGGLYFPNLPTNPMEHPFWTPEFIGDVITVNGKTWPYLSVAPRKYRFRLLNGSNARFYEIQLKDLVTGAIGPSIIQIGTDGGLMDKPVTIAGKLLLAPGERADVVIDFNGTAGRTWTLTNSARTPYPKGGPPNGSTTGRIMQFIVNGTRMTAAGGPGGTDKSSVPTNLRPSTKPIVQLVNFATGTPLVAPVLTRQLTLNEVMGMGGPLEVLVNNTKWGADVTENPAEGTTELWQIINLTADAHPMHLHLVQFQIVSRQPFNLNNYNKAYNAAFPGDPAAVPVAIPPGVFMPGYGPPLSYAPVLPRVAFGGNPDVTPFLQKGLTPAKLNERGWKDTHIVMPGEVTTFIVRFTPTDIAATVLNGKFLEFDPSKGPGYVWHCHIIDHEDNEMMRPYKVTRAVGKGAAVSGNTNMKGISSANTSENLSEKINGVVLEQNYPNPFSGETQISFTLPEAAHIQLTLFNTAGVPVQTLIDAEAPAGLNTVRLDAGNLKGGIYFYQLNTGNLTQVKKMIILE